MWRIFDLLAPSAELHANRGVFPFSIKPETDVSPAKIMELLRELVGERRPATVQPGQALWDPGNDRLRA